MTSDLISSLGENLSDRLDPEDPPCFHPPMLASLADAAFSDPDWVFEAKLDGVRLVAVRDHDRVEIVSRNGKRQNDAYPEIAEAVGALGHARIVLDGEVVAFEGGRTSFSRLQGRMQLHDAQRARATGIAVYYYVFDLLHLDGWSTLRLPLRSRKSLLQQVVTFDDPLRLSTHRNERGEAFFEEACRRGWEGLIAKRADSTYHPGQRSRDWLKLKCVRRQELVIGGFTDPRGSRTGLGALLVGYHDDGRLRYAGKVGTGFSEQLLRTLRAELGQLERDTSPFDEPVPEAHVHWVSPELVCEVGITEWTTDGRLRHPRFVGLREDKDPREVVREEPAS